MCCLLNSTRCNPLRHCSLPVISSIFVHSCKVTPCNILRYCPLLQCPSPFFSFSVNVDSCNFRGVVGDIQTLRRWTEGAIYIRQSGHQVGHWPIFLVLSCGFFYLSVYRSIYLICDGWLGDEKKIEERTRKKPQDKNIMFPYYIGRP